MFRRLHGRLVPDKSRLRGKQVRILRGPAAVSVTTLFMGKPVTEEKLWEDEQREESIARVQDASQKTCIITMIPPTGHWKE